MIIERDYEKAKEITEEIDLVIPDNSTLNSYLVEIRDGKAYAFIYFEIEKDVFNQIRNNE